MRDNYCVILVRRDMDRFGHHDLFADEITPALKDKGWGAKTLDYVLQSNEIFDALKDPDCRFFIAFNGFGTEMLLPTAIPGRLQSAFEAFSKPVFDLMHDCPLHEAMGHQVNSFSKMRHLLSTDIDYAWFSKMLGSRTIVPVATIAFPQAAASVERADRDIDVLFAVGLSSPSLSRDRLDGRTPRAQVLRVVFDEVARRCIADWAANPITELMHLMREVGLAADVRDEEFRFLLTVVLDHVKFARRYRMLEALKDTPITLVTDRKVENLAGNVRVEAPRSAKDLMALMGRSKVVVCPSSHALGFHERPFMAFTMGATVISAPNGPLEGAFSDGNDILFFRDAHSLRASVNQALQHPEIGLRGREKALSQFLPARLVEVIFNSPAIQA